MDSDFTALSALLEKVYRDTGRDFRGYKTGTVTRRLERRLHATGAGTYQDYMRLLDDRPEEYEKLISYMTVNVSEFFRSPYTFRQVTALVLPELIARKKTDGQRSLRFWSAACAAGQEPYSIAMMLAGLPGSEPDFNTSIYATDISVDAINKAREGVYPAAEVEALPPDVLTGYFTRRGEGYAVNQTVKQVVSFAHFDLVSTSNPPVTGIDCVFCCNILIYLQKHLQEKVLEMLYSSLSVPGYLVLGEAEMLTDNLGGKFECLDGKAKIYKKQFGAEHKIYQNILETKRGL